MYINFMLQVVLITETQVSDLRVTCAFLLKQELAQLASNESKNGGKDHTTIQSSTLELHLFSTEPVDFWYFIIGQAQEI